MWWGEKGGALGNHLDYGCKDISTTPYSVCSMEYGVRDDSDCPHHVSVSGTD